MAKILTESYQKTSEITDPCHLPLGEHIRYLAAEDPNKIAFVFRAPGKPRVTLTRQELFCKSRCIASKLIHLGVLPGEKIAVLVTLGANWVTVQFGIYMTGAEAVNSAAFDLDTLRRSARKFGFSGIIYDNSYGGQSELCFETVLPEETRGILHDIQADSPEYDNKVVYPSVSPKSVALWCYSSGSTGEPKLISHTHESLIEGAIQYSALLNITGADFVACDRPMVWLGGYPLYFLGVGASMLYITCPLDSDKNDEFFVNVLAEENPTCSFVFEYRVKGLQKTPALKTKFPTLCKSIVGGNVISKSIVKTLLEISEEVKVVYGCTESLCLVAYGVKELEKFDDGMVGFPTKGSEMKLVDPEGKILPIGQEGELYIRGTCCSSDYIFSDRRHESPKDRDGWYHTGDICTFQENGLITVHGRKTEIIKRASVRIYPAFVERQLKEITDVEDVLVVGVPDSRLYQEVCACVLLKTASRSTIEEIKQQAEAIFKPSLSPDGLGFMPGYFVMFSDFPTTSVSNKPSRALSAIRARKLLKLEYTN